VQGFGHVVEAAVNVQEGWKHPPEQAKNDSPECKYGEQENDANETLDMENLHPRAEFTPEESQRTAGASNLLLELVVGGFGHARERGQGALGEDGFTLGAFEFSCAG
jgi:hypothetical protein